MIQRPENEIFGYFLCSDLLDRPDMTYGDSAKCERRGMYTKKSISLGTSQQDTEVEQVWQDDTVVDATLVSYHFF